LHPVVTCPFPDYAEKLQDLPRASRKNIGKRGCRARAVVETPSFIDVRE
jgi:hypothetical protein